MLQTDNILEEYVSRIQELEAELRQLQNSRTFSSTSSRPPSSLRSLSMVESAAGAGFGVAGIDGDIHLPPGKSFLTGQGFVLKAQLPVASRIFDLFLLNLPLFHLWLIYEMQDLL